MIYVPQDVNNLYTRFLRFMTSHQENSWVSNALQYALKIYQLNIYRRYR